ARRRARCGFLMPHATRVCATKIVNHAALIGPWCCLIVRAGGFLAHGLARGCRARGGKLGVLLIKCPVTGKEVSTGIETDEHSLELMPDTVAQSACPHCGSDHAWSKFDARLSETGVVSGAMS